MLIINEKQTKSGMGDVAVCMRDKSIMPADKRIQNKLNWFKSLSVT